ncbi:MAG: serine O-acetyltransferase [Nitrospirae bacterium CG_4_10_14_3_um_filter_53_41]|nr:MAG: serine O-acetyltransferase [Nitrospirae bacterium CG_4_10_14_3_um_filter_53_41]
MKQTCEKIKSDFQAVFEMDPAATSKLEVILTYSGFHAILAYRFSHWLYKHKVPFFPRLISQLARFLTGVEIHPAATIGKRFFIDHGMGVVIGETSEIGDNVTLYQGVTLGGTGKEHTKRHPTLGNNVVVGAGAKILGSMSIGDNVKIGANAVVLTPVPANSTVVGVPGRIVKVEGEKVRSSLDHIHLPDPIIERFEKMEQEIEDLKRQLRDKGSSDHSGE